MRVIRCPKCNEPLPGFANFCATCGESLMPSLTCTTARLSGRPRTLKIPHLFVPGMDDEDTVSVDELSPVGAVKYVHRPLRSFTNSAVLTAEADFPESLEDSTQHTDWHKIVDSRPLRTPPSLPRIPASLPRTPRIAVPLPSVQLLTPTPQPPSRRMPPALFFWVSMLVLVAIVAGGLFGVVVTLGRGVFGQSAPHHNQISLQVTPSTVALDTLITVNGTSFSPHGKIGFTRDATIPITDTGGNSILQADGQGSFTDWFVVDPSWQAGAHRINAEDALTHKIATFTIEVTGQGPSLRPAHLSLSAFSLDLGSGDQATNSVKTITLFNAGGGQISWQGTTTQSWLMISPSNGTFASGQSMHVTIAADRANLRPGSYSAQVFFMSNAGHVTLPVKMQTTQLQPKNGPVLQLTPPLLSFTGADGGMNPPPQVVTVSNPGALSLQWSTSISGGNGWLSVFPQSGNVVKGGSQAVVIGVNTSTQLPGTYTGVITFASQGPGSVQDSPQSIYVSLTVTPQCMLEASPGSLSFASVYLQSGPAAKIISLNDTPGCSARIPWSAAVQTNNGGHWLNIGSTNGTTPSYPAISVNTSGLKPGQYGGLIVFASAAGTETLPVNFVMGQPSTPVMNTESGGMNFSEVIGQSNPPAQTITINNTGGGVLNWNASAFTNFGGAWLTASPASGSIAANGSATVSVSATLLSGLTPNTYTGTIAITGTDGMGQAIAGSPQDISVSFAVLPPCTIAADPGALNFNGVIGQGNPASQAATITASGTCAHALTWTAATSASWITTTSSSGRVDLSSSSTTKIGVSLSGLSANTYTGHVTISAVDSVTQQAVGSPQTIAVTLTVQPPCTLESPSTTQENFKAEAGTNPASQHFTISLIGACTGNVTITPTPTQSWLAVTPASASITGGSTTFTVTVSSSSLAAGKYTGSISIAAVDGGLTITGSPQTVNVTLNVYAPPALAVSPAGLTINVTTGTTSQPISISNSGGAPLNWTAALASGAPTFVSLSAGAGKHLAGGASTSINVIVSATGVTGGSTYTTSVTISAFDPLTKSAVAGSPVTVGVTINIAAPAMQLSANTLNFVSTVSVNPASQSINLSNNGGGKLTWTAGTPSQSWLTLGVASGNVTTGKGVNIPFSVNVTGLVAGSYTATVVITPSVGNPQTVTVALTLS